MDFSLLLLLYLDSLQDVIDTSPHSAPHVVIFTLVLEDTIALSFNGSSIIRARYTNNGIIEQLTGWNMYANTWLLIFLLFHNRKILSLLYQHLLTVHNIQTFLWSSNTLTANGIELTIQHVIALNAVDAVQDASVFTQRLLVCSMDDYHGGSTCLAITLAFR